VELRPLGRAPRPEAADERVAHYRAALRRRWRLIVAAAIVGAAVGVLLALAGGRSHEATAEMLLPQRDRVAELLGVGSDPVQPERDFDTRVGLITTEPVAAAVRQRLGLTESADALLHRVRTTVRGNSGIVSITARAGDPETAARIANAFAETYGDYRARVARDALTSRVAAARRQLTELGPGAELSREGRDLVDGIRRVQTAAAFQGTDAELVRRGRPSGVSGWAPVPAGALGAVLASLLASGLVLLRARGDHALHDEEELERALGVPVLTRVTKHGDAERAAPGEDGPARDAYAALAARIAFGSTGGSAVALLFTSPGADGPTPQVVLGVTAALRTLGRKAVAVEADPRRPRFTDELGHAPAGGLSAADAMTALIQRARRQAPFVLVAGAPLDRIAEAQVLAPLVDGAILVVPAGATTDDAARRARLRLEDVGVPVVGAVLVEGPSWAPPRIRVRGHRS
jgi:succinoglycan biosynthesis transport protein ExoP